ncbi:MAG: LLM class F420-dependent oxidoreductase [Alphaproteobacteria bacterium]|nr:LLM class F420-dependent oxidoreductase [Alphaproteobacteria bacterium]
MIFGVSAPFRGPLATADSIRLIAAKAEELGFGYLTVSDHIVVPREIHSTYPYSETGEFPWSAGGAMDCMEQFTLLAWIAAVTTKIRLLTSVAVIPHRNPLFMAKSIATTDQLSGGRVTLGCGAGWMQEEFEALGLPPFAARGRVTNEYLEAMKVLWTEAEPQYEGEFVRFADIGFDPKPVQKPHPPIWIGGESGAAMRRAVALGDAWYPFGSNPRFRMDRLAAYRDRVAQLHQMAETAGRDPASLDLAYNCAFHSAREQRHEDGSRLAFTGSPEQRAEDIRAFEEIGLKVMMVNLTANDLDVMVERMESFANEVMALL